MKAFVNIPLALILIAVSGCATSYHSSGFTGVFRDTQLAPDVFRVSFRGNGYTSSDRAQDFALLRASELTLKNGFTCFAVIDENNSTRTQTFQSEGHATTTGTLLLNGRTATYSGYTTYTPGETFTFFKPSTGLLVQCFQTKPKGIYTFDAAFLLGSLRQKYKIVQ